MQEHEESTITPPTVPPTIIFNPIINTTSTANQIQFHKTQNSATPTIWSIICLIFGFICPFFWLGTICCMDHEDSCVQCVSRTNCGLFCCTSILAIILFVMIIIVNSTVVPTV